MDALTLINEHLDVDKLLEHYDFDKVRPDGSFVRACCKIHGGDNPSSFVMNRDNGLYFCHTGCGGGDAITLIQKLDEVDFQSAVKKLADLMGVDIENMEILERKEKSVEEVKRWIRVMKSRSRKSETHEYVLPVETRPVTKFRDFLPETLEHFGLGYVESVELSKRDGALYTLRNRLVFPIVQNGVQVGVSLRKIKASDVPKWSHQPASIETRNMLYNLDAVLGKQFSIVIVEGIVDVWAYHEIGIPALCTFGAHVTEEQYRILMRTGAELVWSFDGDTAGREATEKAIAMFRNKADMYYVELGEGCDPASISREELRERYDRKIRVG